jgi:DUF4097 and DUF4098 domain-containing protein YvlB
MKFSLKSIRFLSLVVIMAMTVLTVVAEAKIKNETTKSFTVSPGGELILDTDIGSVDIETAAGNSVEVQVVLTADTRDEDKAQEIFDRFQVDFAQDGDEISITGDLARNDGLFGFGNRSNNKLHVGFIITVPEKFNVDLATSAGSISIADLKGTVRAKTSGGSMTFEKIDGPVNARTSGGSISLRSCSGRADIMTSGGSITLGKVTGDVIAHTSGGSISVDEVMGSIDASTSGGSIQAHITRQPEDDCRLVTSGGSVSVYIDPAMNFDLDAQTSAGRVTSDFPIKVRGRISKSSLRAEINDGGPELFLRTSGGNIYLYKL